MSVIEKPAEKWKLEGVKLVFFKRCASKIWGRVSDVRFKKTRLLHIGNVEKTSSATFCVRVLWGLTANALLSRRVLAIKQRKQTTDLVKFYYVRIGFTKLISSKLPMWWGRGGSQNSDRRKDWTLNLKPKKIKPLLMRYIIESHGQRYRKAHLQILQS